MTTTTTTTEIVPRITKGEVERIKKTTTRRNRTNNPNNRSNRKSTSTKQNTSKRNLQQARTRVDRNATTKILNAAASRDVNMDALAHINTANNSTNAYNLRKYMAGLVDPEAYGDGMKVPDNFIEMTMCNYFLMNTDIPLINASGNDSYKHNGQNNFRTGSYLLHVNPSFYDPVQYMAEFSVSADTVWEASVQNQSELCGLRSVDDITDSISDTASSMQASATGQNILAVMNRTNGNANASPLLPFKNSTTDGFFYGYSLNLTNGTARITVVHDYAGATVADGLIVDMVDTTGVIQSTTFALTNAVTTSSTAIPIGDRRGDKMVGFRLRVKSTLSPPQLNILSIRLTFNIAAADPQLSWQTIQWPSVTVAAGTVDRYRFAALSAKVSYVGDAFNNGGQVAALLHYGGRPFSYCGANYSSYMWTLPGLSEIQRGYNGPIRDGSYSWWAPTNKRDITLTAKQTPYDYAGAHIVAAGYSSAAVVDGQVKQNIIRLRICGRLEVTTSVQFLSLTKSPSNPWLLARVKKIIVDGSTPTSMPNDLHDKILSWITSAAKGVKVIGEEIIPAATVAARNMGPLLAALGLLI